MIRAHSTGLSSSQTCSDSRSLISSASTIAAPGCYRAVWQVAVALARRFRQDCGKRKPRCLRSPQKRGDVIEDDRGGDTANTESGSVPPLPCRASPAQGGDRGRAAGLDRLSDTATRGRLGKNANFSVLASAKCWKSREG
jgi:hypothetical protein